MDENRKYKVVVSDRAKRMLGAHFRFMAQVNKEAAAAKKNEIMTALRSSADCRSVSRFLKNCISHRINITGCSLKNGI